MFETLKAQPADKILTLMQTTLVPQRWTWGLAFTKTRLA